MGGSGQSRSGIGSFKAKPPGCQSIHVGREGARCTVDPDMIRSEGVQSDQQKTAGRHRLGRGLLSTTHHSQEASDDRDKKAASNHDESSAVTRDDDHNEPAFLSRALLSIPAAASLQRHCVTLPLVKSLRSSTMSARSTPHRFETA